MEVEMTEEISKLSAEQHILRSWSGLVGMCSYH